MSDAKLPAPPDDVFPATWDGGHALVIEFGDEEFFARCQCGRELGSTRPGGSLDRFQLPWERHVMSPELIKQRQERAK